MFQISLIQEHKKKLKKIDLITKIKIINLLVWVKKEVVKNSVVQKELVQEKQVHQKLIMKKQLLQQQQIKSE